MKRLKVMPIWVGRAAIFLKGEIRWTEIRCWLEVSKWHGSISQVAFGMDTLQISATTSCK